ncbi:MAG: Do family serine endopeptidase [Peptococcia bacterium]
MKHLKINKMLVLYTLLIFLGGVFCGGFYLTVKGYDVPWSMQKPIGAELESNEQNAFARLDTVVGTKSIEKIVEEAGPAVVKIETIAQVKSRSNDFFLDPFDDPFFRHFFGDSFQMEPQPRQTQGLGSGFIISKDGYILTNNHVVEGADEIKVYLTSRQEPYKAKIIGADADLDLAVIKINAGLNLPMLKMGDSHKTKVGNWVIAIGNPYGLDHTVTVGVISAKGRPLVIEGREFKDLIQTDASINPGNSGGPLLNLNGEVVGINTAINAQAQGIGFAIPSSSVLQVLDDLLVKGKVIRPWLGVYMQPVTKELADYFGLKKAEGALVNSVQEDSPASKAGIQRGDIILEFNKKKIVEPKDLQEAVKATKVGDKAIILIYRQNQTLYVTVKIEERK